MKFNVDSFVQSEISEDEIRENEGNKNGTPILNRGSFLRYEGKSHGRTIKTDFETSR